MQKLVLPARTSMLPSSSSSSSSLLLLLSFLLLALCSPAISAVGQTGPPKEASWTRLEEYLRARVANTDDFRPNLQAALEWLDTKRCACRLFPSLFGDANLRKLLENLSRINVAIERQQCDQRVRLLLDEMGSVGEQNLRVKMLIKTLRSKFLIVCQWDYALRYEKNRETINNLGHYEKLWPFFLRLIYHAESGESFAGENSPPADIKQHAFYASWSAQPQVRQTLFSKYILARENNNFPFGVGGDGRIGAQLSAQFALEAMQYILKNQFVEQELRVANTFLDSSSGGELKISKAKNLFLNLIYFSCSEFVNLAGPHIFKPAQADAQSLLELGTGVQSVMKLSANYHLAWLSYEACSSLTSNTQTVNLQRLLANLDAKNEYPANRTAPN